MFRRKVAIAGVGILLFAILIFVVWRQPQTTQLEFKLADGRSIKVMPPKSGKVLRFYEGNIGQKALFALCGTNLPIRWRGVEIVIPMGNTNGGLCVELSRLMNVDAEISYFKKNGAFRPPVNGSSRLVEVSPSGKETIGNLRVVNFDTSTGLIFGHPKIVDAEDIYWELPLSKEREIHFRFYQTNAVDQVVSTNEFTIANPAFK